MGDDDTERNDDAVGGENEPDDSKWPEAVDALSGDQEDEETRRKDSKQTHQTSNPNCLI